MGKTKRKKKRKSIDKLKNEAAGQATPVRKHDVLAEGGETSLLSHLRRERGTADMTPLPREWDKSSKSFLTPRCSDFKGCLATSYQRFCWEEPQDLEETMHESFDKCFKDLEGMYLYDSVQAGGQRVSQTFVRRCLIGNPGSTYKYLGLRLFSHPWSLHSEHDNVKMEQVESLVELGYSTRHAEALTQMGHLNKILMEKTEKQLDVHVPAETLRGSSDYSLTLVNRMEPTTVKHNLKKDPILHYKASVSWHKDSGLQDFSSIAVYHTILGGTINEGVPWRVALRVASSKCKTPALVIPLPSRSLYYLLDDFNHQHEHAVLAGATQLRYSSTHRVSRGGTWQAIQDRCHKVLKAKESIVSNKITAKQARSQQQLWTELEFEWIRQWYIQGQEHADLHPYWHGPLRFMESCWEKLHGITMEIISGLSSKLENSICDVLIEAYEERIQLREKWEERLKSSHFQTLGKESKPIKCSITTTLSDLRSVLEKIRRLRGGKTKKEKRKVASNWEALKSTLKSGSKKKQKR
mmetsp:Transcript_2131/g.3059  ORF Transcript_2131/g.3059 Transcript_2131/m.3059 type:complete len:523 (+) Transcript_2131:140-1708(+)|eukprot:CAMPEP_0178918420 /NCGR_PEP_ID=MMETSP0786-20121207/13821_1 /TAXON_ID=186022 /ORGANISM="Thalassionema frauenfeldii, Strain CCMP 1798" /LENGTH=522 /DNA_ID=CAMNT_0020592137 /DNA_START=45 /DNA_END=1613 /DNA_ORIENTATION=+